MRHSVVVSQDTVPKVCDNDRNIQIPDVFGQDTSNWQKWNANLRLKQWTTWCIWAQYVNILFMKIFRRYLLEDIPWTLWTAFCLTFRVLRDGVLTKLIGTLTSPSVNTQWRYVIIARHIILQLFSGNAILYGHVLHAARTRLALMYERFETPFSSLRGINLEMQQKASCNIQTKSAEEKGVRM